LLSAAENAAIVRQKFGNNSDITIWSDQSPITGDGWRKLELEPAKGRAKDRYKWVDILSKANVKINYIEGKKNPSDTPSRPPFVGVSMAAPATATEAGELTRREWAQRQDASKDVRIQEWHDYIVNDILPRGIRTREWSDDSITD